ncbi:hypothetical protein [Nostoc sp. FACHB-145]|uniref:hypothetical protein n=1 Tax=Nostoc sp. FACHB-145 TaxID=2692836 RepID=UPI001687B566|nr:hypothetical protein [Nostoc sp. FACHB-145]MBD2472376.1 hypothetical protein [Nostoc sp. FACHB-145]
MSDLIYPTLDLFAYNIAEGLGENQDDIKKRRDDFLALLPENIQDILSSVFDDEQALVSPEYIELLKFAGKKEAFQEFDHYLNNYALKGYYYPVRLSDTYGLLFDCSVDEKDNPQKLSSLRYLKQQAKLIEGNLGKTWKVSGIMPNPNTDAELLAKNIYKVLISDDTAKNLTDAAYENLISKQWQYRKAGKFLNASVFEVWRMPDTWKSIEENSHILIFLYPDIQTMQEAAKFDEDWMRLLCYRNKIIWAYCEIHKIKQQLQTGFKTIRKITSILKNKSELQSLKEILENNVETHYSYVINLNYLEIQTSTIEINLHNYKEYLDYINNYIKNNSSLFGDTDLNFLENFNNIVENTYQMQAKKDYANLRPGIDILENQLNTIRGIVEIEKAERERHLENLIATVGVGVGIASIASSAASTLVKDFTQFYPIKVDKKLLPYAEPLSNLIVILAFSIVLGWLASFAVWKFWLRTKQSNK